MSGACRNAKERTRARCSMVSGFIFSHLQPRTIAQMCAQCQAARKCVRILTRPRKNNRLRADGSDAEKSRQRGGADGAAQVVAARRRGAQARAPTGASRSQARLGTAASIERDSSGGGGWEGEGQRHQMSYSNGHYKCCSKCGTFKHRDEMVPRDPAARSNHRVCLRCFEEARVAAAMDKAKRVDNSGG